MSVVSNKKYTFRIMLITGAVIFFLLYIFEYKNVIIKNYNDYVAKVNNVVITNEMLEEFAKTSGKELNYDNKIFALDALIKQEILKIYAKKSGILKNKIEPKFERKLEYEKRNLLIESLYKYETELSVIVTERDLKLYAAKHLFGSYYAIFISKINTKSLLNIQKAKAALEKKIPFNIVSNKYSDKIFASKNGFLGYFEIENDSYIVEPFASMKEELKSVGAHSEIYEAPTAYIIMYRGKNPPFPRLKETIEIKVKEIKQEKKYDNLIKNFKNNVIVDESLIEKFLNSRNPQADNFFKRNIITYKNHLSPVSAGKFYREIKEQKNIVDFYLLSKNEVDSLIIEYAIQNQMVKKALDLKLDKTEEFENNLNRIKVNLRDIQGSYVVKYIQDSENIIVSEDEIKEYYHKFKEQFRKSNLLSLQKIVVNKKELVDDIYRIASNNGNFDSLVRTYSVEKYAKLNLGKTAPLSRDDLKDSYDELNSLQVGKVSLPIMKEEKKVVFNNLNKKITTIKTYTIYKVLDKVLGAIPTLQEVTDNIYIRIYYNKLDNRIEQIKKKFKIKVIKKIERIK